GELATAVPVDLFDPDESVSLLVQRVPRLSAPDAARIAEAVDNSAAPARGDPPARRGHRESPPCRGKLIDPGNACGWRSVYGILTRPRPRRPRQ
ncbi:MAG: hypothetical protein ACT4NY_33685, partial [Pseudonocardiales bacterium]